MFLGYPSAHKGYHCLDLSTHRIIISHHVVFDEFSFPFARDDPVLSSSFDFLQDDDLDIFVPCSTNNVAVRATVAPSSDVEQLPSSSTSGAASASGCGPVPPLASSPSDSGTGGRGSVPPPDSSRPSGSSAGPQQPAPPADPPGRFGVVYTRRPHQQPVVPSGRFGQVYVRRPHLPVQAADPPRRLPSPPLVRRPINGPVSCAVC